MNCGVSILDNEGVCLLDVSAVCRVVKSLLGVLFSKLFWFAIGVACVSWHKVKLCVTVDSVLV